MSSSIVKLTLLTALVALLSLILSPNILAPPEVPASNTLLHNAQTIHLPSAFGPESLAFDPHGHGPYTGVADGRILKWQGHALGWTDFAFISARREDCVRPFAPETEHICGRPLGLRFDKKTGDLYIADAYFGFHVVGPVGGLATQLITEVEDQPLYFTNDMDIDEIDDVIYFTDSSASFRRRQFLPSILSHDKTGRLLKCNKSGKEVKVLLRDLAFANGVALSEDRSFLLVAETAACRILRLWLRGPNAGNVDVFAELPGFPDNIRRNTKGEFWVALHSKRGLFAKLALSYGWFGRAWLKVPLGFKQLHSLFVGGKPHGIAVKLSENGEVLQVLEDTHKARP
ncbi:Protein STRICTOSIDINE SYNTHASE-LIKE 10 [Hibiscus syriacus]|uniref:Protein STRICTOSIDINE SYNTHASE-LIKE 10 n=1 Tax=Hibiscus syriacus TaxID=106335 RepID=A0A6A2XV13_HIBSY|nr:Protein STRICTOSIDINE SYNTHASE-LIKE 10 [Hibiscus syriacus]